SLLAALGAELQSSPSGYDTLAPTSLLSLVDRLAHHLAAARPAANVDRQLRPRRAGARGNVTETDAHLEHGRQRARRHLAPALDRHALSRDRLFRHAKRDELPFRPALFDVAEYVGADELGV